MGSPGAKSNGHFRATITIFPLGPKTRSTHPFNGIRWGFVYADEFDKLGLDGNTYHGLYSDVFPEFMVTETEAMDADIPLQGTLFAIMHILAPNMIPVHFERLKIGTSFYCMEGSRPCAEGKVTKLSV